ncbi:amidase domain-containing protein [Desulfovirgula thermocuniculi]|uniref:amidase domain-containing protein n=1 Tax=Desulfovirgula thermocuniculi TaxID=348842 RepID=UPI000429EE4B|nr:amidase domain-containing protein [Desulfovirgula thermocuniculi]
MRLWTTVLPLLLFFNCLAGGACAQGTAPPAPAKEELMAALNEIFGFRARALLTGAPPPLDKYYDTDTRLGRWALAHEQGKVSYVQAWAAKRGVRFVEANAALRVPWWRWEKDAAELLVHHSLQLGYVYPGDAQINRFGIGTRHWMKLVKKDGRWLIQQDFYLDGLGDDSLAEKPTPADGPALVQPVSGAEGEGREKKAPGTGPKVFDREGAVRYADKYAGLAWGAGNDHRYNSRYRDLNDRGGDCTNFVSQCLGDREEGGRLPMDGTWYYRYDRQGGSGSRAWVQTEAFARWLLYSGRARRIARGTFAQVNQPTAAFPRGAVRELQKGDLIGYEEKGHIEHFAIVVGADSGGYPVVNAHTVDRYHCPWDIGWDKSTVFHLFKIRDEL